MQTYELVIIGAGLSGLSISNQLIAKKNWNQPTLLLDSRNNYENDKSWCFWLPKDKYLQKQLNPIITKRWSNWKMAEILKQTPHRPYCYIASEDFYNFSLEQLNTASQMKLNLNSHILDIQSFDTHHEIHLKNQPSICARHIIDTRPPRLECQTAPLWQVFLGFEIKSPAAIFEENTMELMHQLTAMQTGVCFQYILPFNAHHALIETTYIGNKKIDSSELYPLLTNFIDKNYSKNQLHIHRQEQGILPMGLAVTKINNSKHYQYAGIASGAIRPSSGYAFLRIQKQAERIAKCLIESGKLPSKQKEPWLMKNMDNLFIKVCHKYPQLIANFFSAFANKVPAERLVEFLSDECHFLNCLQVANALPKGLFIQETFKNLGKK